ncbi:p53 and DNA damage-regulated protein 1 [Physocladia obscura]|uniref:P53 and DNA damage-regulated protein 1 n=1 Tax=Physocladia obscura TaxID=109957 RepID=A0AAD5T5C1_9FUNG|nr:p53 and DNA damage-regulated protein 1 [Physocladia obscura]
MDALKDQAEVERLAEDILAARQLLIDLDRRRNETREALACFRQAKVDPKVWFFAGDFSMRLDRDSAKARIESEQEQLNDEIETIRTSLKESTRQLELLEARLHPNAKSATGAVSASTFSNLKPANLNDLLESRRNK